TLATCTISERTVKLWDLALNKEIGLLSGHSDTVGAAAFSADGTTLATCSFDQTIRLWDRASGALLQIFRGHADEVYDLTFSPDGNLLASGDKAGVVKLWDRGSKASRTCRLDGVIPSGFNSDGSFRVFFETNSTLAMFDPESSRMIHRQRLVGSSEEH